MNEAAWLSQVTDRWWKWRGEDHEDNGVISRSDVCTLLDEIKRLTAEVEAMKHERDFAVAGLTAECHGMDAYADALKAEVEFHKKFFEQRLSDNDALFDANVKLKAEVERLREALEEIITLDDPAGACAVVAEKALEQLLAEQRDGK